MQRRFRDLVLAPENECVFFTSKGRQLVIQWLAFATAAEMDALEGLTYDETQQLKLLLGRVIQHTGVELPAQWHKENIWQQGNSARPTD